MPIYEYECPSCGRVEIIQRATDKALSECPVCKEKGKKSKITKAISAASFHLKGTGWYKTDYTSKGGSSSTESSSAAASDSGSKAGDTSSKAEPATKKGCGTGCACH